MNDFVVIQRIHKGKMKMRLSVITLVVMLIATNVSLAEDVMHDSSSSCQLHTINPQNPQGLRELFRYTGDPLNFVGAHRGGPQQRFPENCIATFESTLQHTFAIMEIDPRYTKDGQIVVHHDATLDRTTTGKGPVAELTLQELKELRVKDAEGNVTGHRIATLDDVLRWARGKTILVLDQKDVPVEARVKKIEEHRAEAYAILIVYSFEDARKCYELNRNIMMEVMIPNREKFHQFDETGVPWSNIIAFVGHTPPEDKELLQMIHAKGACCMAGTSRNLDRELIVNRVSGAVPVERRYRALLELGVDVIETDLPIEVGKLLYSESAIPASKSKFFQRPSQEVDSGRAALQEDFLKLRFGLFLHFNMATYVNREWANGYEDPALFKPDKLDCNQWADVACAAGMKYGVLTVKHTGGWCLWDSEYTTHDIASFINYRNGGGDIVREFVDAFRSHGLKVGFYYCFPGDFSNTSFGDAIPEGRPDLHGLPPEAAGDYVGFIKLQLSELLTKYGPVDLLWIDQYSNKYTLSRWQEIFAYIKSLQPRCLVIGNNAHNLKDSDVYSCEFPWDPKSLPPEGNKIPSEVCDKISRTWFWNTGDTAEYVKDVQDIIKMLKLSNERNANYLLNVPPDRNGLISGIHLKRMQELAAFVSAQADSETERKAEIKALPVRGYELVWSDEFEGDTLDFSKWDYRGLGPRRDAINVKDTISVDGKGHLVLTTKRVGDNYHTAMISTQGKYETTFGYFECRIKFQKQIGHWSAFWLQSPSLGKPVGNPNKAGTEIDIFEYLRNRGDKIQHALHWDGYGKDHKSAHKITEISGLTSGWHTVGFLWTPTHYVFYVDGKETWRTDKGVSHRPEYMILSLEVGKWAGEIAKAKLPDHLYVDYVRVYKEVAAKP